ncbi:hypothetical protein, partial [uncultured Thalassospira sp.]|uniref:hypothetical protein n=1 Tax=uncultured Thalassospira sp. TaxID=404382 RepID=UPI0030DA22DD
LVFILFFNPGTRIDYIGEHHARTAENFIFQRYVVIDRDIVLDLHPIPENDLVSDKNILPQGTPGTYARTTAHMNPMPNAAIFLDFRALIHDRCLMDKG